MSSTIFVATYPSRNEAEQTARVAATAVPGTEHLIVDTAEAGNALDRAIEARAARSAVKGVAGAMVISLVVTLVMIILGTHETGTLLAVGLAITATAAPFAGGLTGFMWGLHRWTAPEVVSLHGHQEATSPMYLLAMRAPDAERLPEALRVPTAA